MNFEVFKKLKNEIKDKNFYNNYKGFSSLSYFISYIGNAFSILFAYFYVNNIISSTVLTPTPTVSLLIVIASITILLMLELIKRFIFDKFSQSFIFDKLKFQNNETIILGIVSVMLIATSFYLSLNGAHKFADRKDDIKMNADNEINIYSDSLNKKYDVKINEFENQNKTLFLTNQGYEERISNLSKQYNDGTLSGSDLRRVKQEMNDVRKDKDVNNVLVEKNDSRIKELKTEKELELKKFGDKKLEYANKTVDKTSSNPMIFFIFSTVIELLILFGIWFINYFKIRSVGDYERLITKDPKYKMFNIFNEFINIIYKTDTKIGDLLPFKNELIKILKANSLDLNNKELDDILRILTHNGVLKAKGNKKSIGMIKEDAIEIIKNHLKVE